ncbi:excisionase [Chitinimonas taiwanensis]|uniref:excisionase n=1 Tax=Chitinimonas taiwanensis TaxID=240412 RepID=UPI0035B3D591
MTPQLIPLEQWAQATFGEFAPCLATLRRWAREGYLHPAPEKVGRTWFVKPSSRYQAPGDNLVPVRPTSRQLQRPLIRRLTSNGTPAKRT